ncbi:secreted protein containing N-terminal Zinc-dependent carboxypeptidase related domain [Jejuia pallidilutea]|uniref:Secreted protein containing N-terminal Zinc-dependent carboxypeptidase related domain n=1 Tax=Jejuia pallidilutea TaxID=504487 RepID=A0A098LX22_9FLAO|nr:secreted protein containing N-terminal Zinc-dependent carboxypeptidase related domain [Jejuia pallidilutea]
MFAFALTSQNNTELSYYLPQNVTYNTNIPTPESVIGHPVGKWHVTHDKLVQYMYALAEASDRIAIENRGKTFEDRPLLLLTITSPENIKNIETIRNNHIEATNTDTAINTKNRPIVVYQGYSIHGNEPSGSNAVLLVAYYLAAAQGNAIENMLQNTVILLDPAFNPDGLQRFAYWANTNKNINLNPDPNDREYSEVWPGGRTNHYWFDMNRDWLPVQLPESRARIKTFHKWLPNILTDHHEMGTNSTFFFQPGIPSRTHPLTPKLNQELTAKIGNYHAKALDKIGSLYFTEESYDDFYYGKGSTFPDINGSIGILFEQASSRGHIQESDNGILTFPFTIRNQFTTSLSTLKAANNLREEILKYQHNFYKNARKESAKQHTKAIVFGDEKDAAKTFHLAEILNRHKIIIHDIKDDFSIDGKNFKKGYSYIVPKHQKNSRLINAMFEKRTTFQDSLFYDISAWSFPLAFNLDYAENVATSNLGEQVNDLKLREGGVSAKSDYAYLVEWHEYYSPKLLNTILSKDLRAKVALKQFSLNGVNYDYGTIMVPVQNQKLNAEDLYTFLHKAAKASHVTINGVNTGLTQGIDLGSRNFSRLEKPNIALLVGDGISSYDAGEIWHLLDTRYNITATKLDTKNISRVDLSRYNTIIIPNLGSLGDTETKKLKEWTKNGGTIIGYRNTVKWLEKQEFIKAKFNKTDVPAKNISFEDASNFRGAQRIGGAIFEAKLDRSHPITFGYKNNMLAMFRNTTIFMKPDSLSYNNPIKYTKTPLLSGYISKPNLEALAETVPVKIKNLGKGKVVAFTDNTNFRAFWYGTNKLLMNAIFFRDEL